MAGVQKVNLNNLNINLKNPLITGIIIAKNSPRILGTKKKNGDARGVTAFTLRDSEVDTINADVWGSEYFILTFYERFLVGDVVEITNSKICIKTGNNEIFRPQVSSPFHLVLNEGVSKMTIHEGDSYSTFLPLLHIPTKSHAGYCGLAEIMKLSETNGNIYVDLLVVVKAVKPPNTIRTKTGADMLIRSVDIMDNTSPATLSLDMFDNDTIRRAEEWRPLESVLFIADARVTWRNLAVKVQVCQRTVITHQPHTADAEALLLYIRNQVNTQGGEAAAWRQWSGERASAASVVAVRARLSAGAPFCASLHAVLTYLDLEELVKDNENVEELRVRFADHTGELSAQLPVSVLEDALKCTCEKLKAMSPEERSAIRWRFLLEQCTVKLAASPPKVMILVLRRASPADTIPLY